jgi:hypothetical protein
MIILGDKLVPYEDFCFINHINDIVNTKPNSTLLFKYDEELLKYCYDNSLNYAVIVDSIKNAIYSNSLGSKYIISLKELSKQIQIIADTYMFDSKNIAIIDSNDEFESIAKAEIDGVIYTSFLN